jgi:hypothetical protein
MNRIRDTMTAKTHPPSATDPTHPTHQPHQPHPTLSTGARELAAVLIISGLLTAALTYPVLFKIGHVGRVDNGDGQWSIWIVAWVARTLVLDPWHVFDANIFYPHRGTLAYSENNLGAGALAIPAYWLTGGNPYAGHNTVVLLSFILTATGTYYLVRYLTHDRRAATVSAICFAFCPYLFAHMAHIQLLIIAGLPFSMLAFHRMADRPTIGRGAGLGAAMAAQAVCCGYYGVFVMLMIGFAILVVAGMRRMWTDRAYWTASATSAAVSLALVIPLFRPYVSLRRDLGFERSLNDARTYSANWSAYLASSSYAHAWLLRFLPPWGAEVIFPGTVALVFGVAGLWLARRMRGGELTVLYGGLAALACWTSFGPAGGLYSVLYRTVPVFALMRAPGRFGAIVAFALSVLAGAALATLLPHMRRGTLVGIIIAALAAAELKVPLRMPEAIPVEPVYRALAVLPRAPVIEMPFFYPQVGLFQHTKYMLASTSHWFPLVNGYSDYIPPDFYQHVMVLATFPSRGALKTLEPSGVRYAVFHMNAFNTQNRNDVLTRIEEAAPYLRLLYRDDFTRLYEIVGFPK